MKKKIELTDEERQEILGGLVRSFIATAASYGFVIDEIIDYLSTRKEEVGA